MNGYQFFVRRNWTSFGTITIGANNEEEAEEKIEEIMKWLDIRIKNYDGSDFNHLDNQKMILCGLYDSHLKSDLRNILTEEEAKDLKDQLNWGFDIVESDHMDSTYYELEEVFKEEEEAA